VELLVSSVGDQSLFDIAQDLLFRLRGASKPLDKSKVFGEVCLRPLQRPISTIASSGSAKLDHIRRKLVQPLLGVS
jgi:hypothetical protein